MADRGFAVRALGEIAIRCRDFEAMTAFYRDVIGLVPLEDGDRGRVRFFDLGPSHGGHRAVLALFRPDADGPAVEPQAGQRSSLHHLALALPAEEQAAAVASFEARGLPARVEEFDWIGWRGVFTTDPDGNTVELVANVPKTE